MKRRYDCRVCGCRNLQLMWDFGMTPLANSYVAKEDLDKPEMFYPLQVNQCTVCENIQLAHIVDPELLFTEYLYSSSTSSVFVKHFEDFAAKMGKKKFVIDIGGNDGILLKPFEKLGSKVLNVEPAQNIQSSVPKLTQFFNSITAGGIVNAHGKADLVTATNVFAHIDDLDDVVKGVKIVLEDDGVFMIEVADVDVMLKKGSFDLIYHEHLNYWSEKTLREFLKLRGMKIIDVEHIPVHGGSLRVYANIFK